MHRNNPTCQDSIQTDVFQMLHQLWSVSNLPPTRIPCNHPCSLMRADLPRLAKQQYWVGPKTDGVRMFLLCSYTSEEDYAVFVDRTGAVERVDLTAPLDAYSGTLLDGELVTHTDGTRTYLVFDAIAVNGYSMIQKAQSERMAAVLRFVHTLNVGGSLKLRVKQWFPLGEVPLNEVASSANTPTDGLIFVPERGPLHPGQQRDQFKWKPVTHHTIDMVWREGELWVEKWGDPTPASGLGITRVVRGKVEVPEGGVVECSMTRQDEAWTATFVRVRTDKLHPNDLRVARLTLQNVEENIGLDELQ
jgi:hypothetical protein